VKFGDAFFPQLGQGEVFRISPVVSNNIVAEINRTTGAIMLANTGGADVALSSLTISSAFGSVDAGSLTPITGHYDASGNGAVDPNDAWSITSPAGSNTLFSETTTGDAGTLGAGEQIVLSPGGGWLRSPTEDLFVSLLLGSGTVLNAAVTYMGNGGRAFARGDLNFNGSIDLADWSIFAASSYTTLTGLSRAEAYAVGDLDADGDNDHADFLLFKRDFNAANGLGAFEAQVLGVPEPATLRPIVVCFAAWLIDWRRASLKHHGFRRQAAADKSAAWIITSFAALLGTKVSPPREDEL
jgi:hypothetical protein